MSTCETNHGVHALVDARNGAHGFLGESDEVAVVDAEAETSNVLFREEDAGSKRGVGWLDPAVARVLVQLGLEGAVLLGVHPVDPVTRGNGVGHQIDPVVGGSGRGETLWRKVLWEHVGEARE